MKLLKKLSFLSLIGLMFANFAFAQTLVSPFEMISHKKTSHIHMEDGKEIKGSIKKLDRKKGLIEEVKIKTEDGKKMVLETDKISHMYLPESGLGKLAKEMEFSSDATQWNSKDIDRHFMNDGYAYFEKMEVQLKKKKRTLILQLLNPDFADKIRIYHDPFAAETASFGVAGVKLAGGDDKSYYVSLDGKTAFKLQRKDFEKTDMFKKMFGDNEEIMKKYGDKILWKNFVECVYEYSK